MGREHCARACSPTPLCASKIQGASRPHIAPRRTTPAGACRFAAVAIVAGLSLAGCGSAVFDTLRRVQGPVPVVEGAAIEKVDLVTELGGKPDDKYKDRDDNTRLALAYKEFYVRVRKRPSEGKRFRNRIQGRLLQASDQACGVYINFLRQFETEGEFGLGSLAVILGGAGAIVTGAGAARALSGAAGMSEGLRAEFRQAFFSNLATHIIVPGFEHRRQVILDGEKANKEDGILEKWDKSLDEYPVETAIKDALFYHAHCNLMAGLVESADLIQLAKRPGINALNQALKEMGETRTFLDLVTGKSPKGAEPATEDLMDLVSVLGKADETLKFLKARKEEIEKVADAFLSKYPKRDYPKTNTKITGIKDDSGKNYKAAETKKLATDKFMSEQLKKLQQLIEKLKKGKVDKSVVNAEFAVVQAKIRVEKNDLKTKLDEVAAKLEQNKAELEKVGNSESYRLKFLKFVEGLTNESPHWDKLVDLTDKITGKKPADPATAQTALKKFIEDAKDKYAEIDKIIVGFKTVLGRDAADEILK